MENLVFGPVPSRRLGKSLGVNNIPHKTCSYSCTYCQVGKTNKFQVDRKAFYYPNELVFRVKSRLANLTKKDYPNYISIVPDGEPTLDKNLGELILKLKSFGVPVAIITNASLLTKDDIQEDLLNADFVSIKVDSVVESSWRKINNPHNHLNLNQILTSIHDFSRKFTGDLVTETMLVKGLNDSEDEINKIGYYLQSIKPKTAFISTPMRPTSFDNIYPVDETVLAYAFGIFSWFCLTPELLTSYEGDAFVISDDFVNDLLGITSVHPMRKVDVLKFIETFNRKTDDLDKLINKGLLKEVIFNNQTFIIRSFQKINTVLNETRKIVPGIRS